VRSCSNGQFTVGYRESDVMRFAPMLLRAAWSPSPLRMQRITRIAIVLNWQQMQKLALCFGETRRKARRAFAKVVWTSSVIVEDGEDEDEDEAARAPLTLTENNQPSASVAQGTGSSR